MQVLYVDDEETIGRVVGMWLKRRGHTVHLAGDLATARAQVEQHPIDAAFIDLRLRNESGIELQAWLEDEYPHVAEHVAFVSGDVVPNEHTERLLANFGRPVLAKPFELGELERLLHVWKNADTRTGPDGTRGAA
jgi:DNA-binding response OmpR family regulator